MAKQKTIPELEAEKSENERKLSQLQHKKQQIENRITYYEKGGRHKRAHHLITRGAAIESVAPLTKVLTETEFYAFAEKLLPSRRSKACLWKRSTNTTGQNRKRGVEYRSISFSCHTNQAQCRTIRYCVCRLSLRRKAAQRILRRGQRLKWKSRPCSRILKYRNDRLKIWSSLSRGHTNTRTWTSLPRMLCVSLSKEFILKHPTRAAASGDRTSAFPMILWVLSR